MKVYTLLDGRSQDLSDLDKREQEFLASLKDMAEKRLSYFEILRIAVGPGSPALGGRNVVTAHILESPLYLVARDVATRAGIKEGLILAPEHESLRATLPRDGSFISVTQAANLIGMSRSAVHQAIKAGKLEAQRVGNVQLVLRSSAEAYKQRTSERASHKARPQLNAVPVTAGGRSGRPKVAAGAR